MTTHDLDGAAAWFDRLAVVDRRVLASGDPEAVLASGAYAGIREHTHVHGHLREPLEESTPVTDLVFAPFQFEFMQRALIAAIVVGALCSAIGTYVVLRKLSFIGDGIAHASFAGIVVRILARSRFLSSARASWRSSRLWASDS